MTYGDVERADSALGDIRVLDLSRLLPGPFCTLLLADMGADVIKIEDPGRGDYLRDWPPLVGDTSAMFSALNAGKRSVVLDLKADGGRAAFLQLAERSDVIVESFRPGVMQRLGLDYETLAARNAGIILCSISGYGQTGPYAQRAGHDLNYVGLAGALNPEQPAPLPLQLADIGGGAMMATTAILSALHERARSGRGQHCDVAMLDGIFSWQIAAVAAASAGATAQMELLNGDRPCYSVYRCADGYLSVAALEPQFWAEFLNVIDLPALVNSAFATGDESTTTKAAIEARLVTATVREWMDRFAGHDVCVEPVNSREAALADVQLRERGMVVGGEGFTTTGFPFGLSRTPGRRGGRAPQRGEHTREVLESIGVAPAAIANLVQAQQ